MKTGDLKLNCALVTGASGFLGKEIVRILLSRGLHVAGWDIIDNIEPDTKKSGKFMFLPAHQISLAEAVKSLVKEGGECCTVFHCAGLAHAGACEKEPFRAFDANVHLVMQALEACRIGGCSRFVLPSTGYVYKIDHSESYTEESAVSASNMYVCSKLAAERLTEGYCRSFGIAGTIVRLSNVYGPHSSAATVIGRILEQVRNDAVVHVNDVSPVRDFIYVADVAECMIRLAAAVEPGRATVVNVSTGAGTDIGEVVRIVGDLTNCEIAQAHPENGGAVSRLVLDNAFLKKLTAWAPAIALHEGLRRCVHNSL